MLVLDQTDRSLVIKLAGAVTTTQLDFTAHYADTTTTAFTPGSNIGATNDTTEVTLVAAPAASTQRQVKCIIVHNMDTVAATVIIEYVDDAVRRRICRETLAANATLRLEGAWLSTALQGVTNGDAHDHSGGDGATIPITGGGTGAVTAAAARAALGVSQPAFTAHLHSAMTPFNANTGTEVPLIATTSGVDKVKGGSFASYRWTPGVAGWYWLYYFGIIVTPSVNKYTSLYLLKNATGTEVLNSQADSIALTAIGIKAYMHTIGGLVYLDADDFVSLWAYTNENGSYVNDSTAGNACRFGGFFVCED
jgi:hypothetical protein